MGHQQQSVHTKHIKDLMNNEKFNFQEIGNLFGVSGSAVSKWVRDDRAPKWTVLAVEGLLRRRRTTQSFAIMAVVTQAEVEAVQTVLDAMNVNYKALELKPG